MISTIIVNWFCSEQTARSVRSVLADGEPVEVFVIDNSCDAAEAERLRELLPSECRLIVSSANVGFGSACNIGASHARGDYLFLLNPDAYVLPGALRALRSALDSDRSIGAVSPRAYLDDGCLLLVPPNIVPGPWDEIVAAADSRWPIFERAHSRVFRAGSLTAWRAQRPVAQRALSGAHQMLRRDTVSRIGGLFDERFFMFYEDCDLSLRLRRAGLRQMLVPEARAVHHYRHAAASKEGFATRSKSQYFDKHYPRSLLVRLAQRLQSTRAPGPVHDLGPVEGAPVLAVPPALRSGWLLEVGVTPSFILSAGRLGAGDDATFPDEFVERLLPGRYFLRLSAPQRLAMRFFTASWVKAR